MKQLTYRGAGSTRFKMLVVLILLASIFMAIGKLPSGEWVELMKWAFFTYAGSESINKGAEALRDRGAEATP